MSTKRIGSRLSVVTAAAVLAIAPAAAAYVLPGVPGTPGGPPTKAKHGTGTSKGATNKVADALAGFTAGELASKGSFGAKVHFPKAGSMSCSLKAGSTKLGAGSATANKAESKVLSLKLSSGGVSFLNAHNGKAVTLTVSCKFSPTHGSSSTSKSTVVTDP